MVLTRKKHDDDATPGGEFVALRGTSNKRVVRSDSEDYAESSSEDDIIPQKKRQRVTVREQASRSLDSRISIDNPQKQRSRLQEMTPTSTSSPRRTRSIKSGKNIRNRSGYIRSEKDDDDEEDNHPRSPRKTQVPLRYRDEDDDEVEVGPKLKGKRIKERRNHDANENSEVAPRRSSRERKMIYSTMNQSLIGNCYSSTDILLSGGADVSPPVSSTRRKKKQVIEEDEGEEEEEEEEEEEVDEDRKSNKSDRGSIDMYSRIKKRRISEKGANIKNQEEEGDDTDDENDPDHEQQEEEDDSDDDTSEEESSEEEIDGRKNYSLRRQRRPPDRFEATIEEPIPRRALKDSMFDQALSPFRKRLTAHSRNLTPIGSPHFSRRSRKHATHHSSSTSSDSDDERRFDRRKKKSMAKARMRCLPMNLKPEDVASGPIRDRQRIGSSLADVDPMNIDSTVTFESVGGLGRHVQSLKEMVVFPLLYPEVFERFKIAPPRGVLFHGPPGTGKTLVARALANESRHGDKRVAFFMRKGADCLSKWVGESERQLRLLFDQAFQMRPSIIFFDEIDGLAPVRSSRQDQIHSSIVSTLLALMDGLDSRGEIVVIGATNRIDSIDPALRRPGRFDREFLFPLPSRTARESILTIHTKEWNPKLSGTFIREVSEKCVGYCGADIKALCTEAGLSALRHQYPQIYASKEKLQLDLSRIQVSARDFLHAMQTIVPAAQRAVAAPGRSLSHIIRPLLKNHLARALEMVKQLVPAALYSTSSDEGKDTNNMVMDMLNEDDFSEEEEDGPCIFANQSTKASGHRRRLLSNMDEETSKPFMNFTCAAYSKPSTHRPRLLLAGEKGQGQSSHLAPAILHFLERLPVHCLDLAALYAVSAKSPEESCAQVFREAQRNSPSIIYMPHICQWWDACGETTRATFLTLLQDLPPNAPILVLATSDSPLREIPMEIQVLFGSYYGEVITMKQPTADEKREFFKDLVLVQAAKAPIIKRRAAAVALQVLEPAPAPEAHKLTHSEQKQLQEKEEKTLRELRLFLRDVLSRLATEKKFRVFAKPVDPEEVPDYGEVVEQPMDLSTMMNKINMHKYTKARQFLDDIDLVTSNALEYNPDRHPEDRIIRNRACELKDSAYAIVQTEMDSEFEKLCEEIVESRTRRGDDTTKMSPNFYRVLPGDKTTSTSSHNLGSYPVRYSRRALGMETDQLSAAEEAMLYASSRPERKKPKRRMKSRWSRGFVPNLKKKRASILKEEDDEEETDEHEGQDIVENGVMEENREDDNRSKESAENNCTDAVFDGKSSPRKADNNCSDNESIISGEMVALGRSSRRSGRITRNSSHSSETKPLDNSPAASTSPANLKPYVVLAGHISRGSSPRVLENVPPLIKETNHNDEHDDDTDSGKTEENTNGMCNSISEDGPTSSLDPLSSLDNGIAQEQKDGEDDQMDTEVAVGKQDKPVENTEDDKIKGDDNSDDTKQNNARMVTRHMIVEEEAQRAREILEASLPKLIIDTKRLEALLESIVEKTTDFYVDRLERLHCILSQCIYRHRRDYDKSQLIYDMETEVNRLIKL